MKISSWHYSLQAWVEAETRHGKEQRNRQSYESAPPGCTQSGMTPIGQKGGFANLSGDKKK